MVQSILIDDVNLGSTKLTAGSPLNAEDASRCTAAGGLVVPGSALYQAVVNAVPEADQLKARGDFSGARLRMLRAYAESAAALATPSAYDTVAALQAVSMVGVPAGTVFYTKGPRAMRLTLVISSTAADNLRTFASATAGSIFYRDLNWGVAGACEQSQWHISPTGNDNADGLTAATPIFSIDELNYRLAGQNVAINLDVYCYGHNDGTPGTPNYAQTFSPNLEEVTVNFRGVRDYTASVSGACTMTAWNNSTKTVGKMVLASGNWSALVGKPIELTGLSNCIAWVTEEIVSGTAITPGPFNTLTRASVSASGSQAWRSYDMATLGRLRIAVTGRGAVVFNDIYILSPESDCETPVTFNACMQYKLYQNTSLYYGCHLNGVGVRTLGRISTYYSCSSNSVTTFGVYDGWQAEGKTIFLGQNLFRGSPTAWAIFIAAGSSIVIGDESPNSLFGALAIYGAKWGLMGDGVVSVVASGFLWGIDIPATGVLARIAGGVFWRYGVAGQVGTSDILITSPANFVQLGVAGALNLGGATSTLCSALPAYNSSTPVITGFIRDSFNGS